MNTAIAQRPCAVQFCPATSPRPSSVQPWHCARHRWPGGEGNEGLTVLVHDEDARFLDGVQYDVEFNARSIRGRVRGTFALTESGTGRLRFETEAFGFVAVDPLYITRVVAI